MKKRISKTQNSKEKAKPKKKAAVIGGGLTGMAVADRLLISGFDVTIIEKNSFLGGLAASFEHRGRQIPIYYHHVFSHDNITKSYLGRFGLIDNMVWKRIKMCILVNGKKYNFTDPHSLLKFDYLSFFGRIRYGLFGAYVLFLMNPKNIDDKLNAKEWLYQVAGKEVADKIFYHLQARNKFGIKLNEISAKQFAHRLKAGEAIGVFGYPKKGLQLLIDRFEQSLIKRGCNIIKSASVKKIDLLKKEIVPEIKDKNKLKKNHAGINSGSRIIKYDVTVNTIPVPEFLKAANGLPDEYRKKLSKIKYCPAVSITIGADKLMSYHYWINVLNERIHMIMQHSWLFDGYKEKISWVLRYGGSAEDLPLSDSQIRKEYLSVVKKYFPEIKILWSRVFREKYASPIYDKDYYKYKPDYRSPVPGLYNAGIAVSYPKIRNMNTAFESGLNAARIIIEDQKSKKGM